MQRTARTPTPDAWRSREPVYATLQPVVDGVARLLFRIRIRDASRLPEKGPAVVVANHVSHLDPLVAFSVLTRAGRRPRFVALADLWSKPFLGWLVAKGRMIPVHRGEGSAAVEAMVAAACAALDADQVVAMYPEGRLPRPGEPQRPRAGAGRLLLATDAPVVPLAMFGVPPWTGRLPRPRQPVDVAVGTPLALDDLRGQVDVCGTADHAVAVEASQRALDAIGALTSD